MAYEILLLKSYFIFDGLFSACIKHNFFEMDAFHTEFDGFELRTDVKGRNRQYVLKDNCFN